VETQLSAPRPIGDQHSFLNPTLSPSEVVRKRNRWRSGSAPGGHSLISSPVSAICSNSAALPAGYGRSTPLASTATVRPPAARAARWAAASIPNAPPEMTVQLCSASPNAISVERWIVQTTGRTLDQHAADPVPAAAQLPASAAQLRCARSHLLLAVDALRTRLINADDLSGPAEAITSSLSDITSCASDYESARIRIDKLVGDPDRTAYVATNPLLLGPVSKSGLLILWQDRRMLRLTDFIIDCPDTMKLAAFYSEVTGRSVKEGGGENWAGIQFGEIELAFVRVEGYRAPQWPDSEHPKQFHLDFEVDDIEAEQSRVLALGATLQQDSISPDGYGWRVYTDPIGHPFCLCHNKGVAWTDRGLIWSKSE
jgi:predicted enzyme related to lactoylglutathione lyase